MMDEEWIKWLAAAVVGLTFAFVATIFICGMVIMVEYTAGVIDR
jgi:hypothetical protein